MEDSSYDDINTAFNNLSLNHSIIKEIIAKTKVKIQYYLLSNL